MASLSQLKSGKWRAQVYRDKQRQSASFDSKEQAEEWAKNIEARISSAGMELTKREEIDLFNRGKERAKARGIEYLLTKQDMLSMYAASAGRCTITGIPFNRFMPVNSTKRPWFPSLDRIDSSKPYTVENCRFVCVAVNIAMGEWGDWVINAIARAIVKGENVVCLEDQAERYRFPPIGDGKLTYRQIVRRRIRAKNRDILPPESRQS